MSHMKRSPNLHHFEGYALALCATFLHGSAGILGRMVYRYEADILSVATLRSIIATILVCAGMLVFRRDLFRIKMKDVHFFVCYGLFGMFGVPLCFLSAIKYTTVATASILLSSSPIFVILFSALCFREALTLRKGAALALTLSGSALAIQCYRPNLLAFNLRGILFGLGASLFLAAFILLSKHAVGGYHSWTIIFYGMLFGTVFLSIFHIAHDGHLTWKHPVAMWFWLLLQALLPAILSDVFYLSSLRYLEAGKVSLISSFQVVAALLLSMVFLGERLDIFQSIGATLVLLGILSAHEQPPRSSEH